MKPTFIFLLLWLAFAAKAQQKILFVGNSLTYYNNLPEIVKKIARQNGHKIIVQTFAKPNYALEDHWNEGEVVTAIRNNHYNFVILQQGPSALKSSRENLLHYALLFSKLCRESKTKAAFYMVWPSGDRSFDFENVIYSYRAAADTTQGLLCPAGQAWLNVFSGKKNFPFILPMVSIPASTGACYRPW